MVEERLKNEVIEFIKSMENDFYINLHQYSDVLDGEFLYNDMSLLDLISVAECYFVNLKSHSGLTQVLPIYFINHIVERINSCPDISLKNKAIEYVNSIPNIGLKTDFNPFEVEAYSVKDLLQQYSANLDKEIEEYIKMDQKAMQAVMDDEKFYHEQITKYNKVKSDTYV